MNVVEGVEKKNHFAFFGVALLIIIHILINYIWLKRDNFPLWFDYGAYFERSTEIYYAGQTGVVNLIKAVLGMGNYACAYHPYRFILPLFSIPWYFIMGLSPDAAVMGCSSFLAIALFSTYAIASRMFDKTTGFLAAFVLSVSPGFFTFYRRFSPEFAVIAMIALTAYLLLRSQNFQNRPYSILFGIGFALCMFTKEMAFAFIPAMLFYAVCRAGIFSVFKKHHAKVEKRVVLNLILSLSLSGVMVFLIYWLHRGEIFYEFFRVAYSNEMRKLYGMLLPYSVRGLAHYGHMMLILGFLPFYSIWFFVGALFCLIERNSNRGFLFAWLIGSYALLCSTQTRVFEYSIPLIIPMAILASYGITRICKHSIKRIMLIVFVVAWGAVQLYIVTFPIPKLPNWVYHRSLIVPIDFKEYHPVNEDWKLEEIIRYILYNKDSREGTALVHVGANLHAFSTVTLSYVATQEKTKLRFCGYAAPLKGVLLCDFIVIKSGKNQGISYSYKQMHELKSTLDASNDFIKLPEAFSVADGSVVEIYKKV